ncbi:phosphatidylinositol-glycan biosynthesis class f protein-related [Holotrichia oblita]|uniref:Phosphatidylinositol-glycan biosynthesis class f protein-related n=2 Tax=Holotrichia oblita TaxID=644536 RepID=A0ACB9TXX9_HOLOL|nr:phosphatidylinositol-glycan biosynthesis class f protein-related [Holotrichia oblita]KAI4471460.1 phosphatidylinositol-glycan biosynthesis class f protein-related [Holotrichia oblita]
MIPTIVYYLVPTIVILITVRKYRESKWGKCKNNVKLTGKIVIVTGANSGIGYEISKELCKRGALVVMACRDKQKALTAIHKIQQELSTKNLVFMELNLASLSSIKAFADNFKSKFDKIDILVNNAGVSFDDSSNKVTEDGFEIHFGVNHLGHFFLTNLLLDKFVSGSRIIIVSSLLHQKGKIDFDNLNLEKPNEAKNLYANSKLANMYFCKELAKKVYKKGIKVYAVCPGWVLTNLFRNHTRRMLMYFIIIIPAAFLFMRSPKQGAQTPIFCATDPSIENESGCFYRDCRKFTSKVQKCDAISHELWSVSEKMLNDKGISLNSS